MVERQRRPNMIGGVVIVIGLLFLGAQFMDASSTVSLASEFHIPANHEFKSWAVWWKLHHRGPQMKPHPQPPRHRLLKRRHRHPSSMIESRDEEINPSGQHWRLTQ